ncbi:hypothetical protein [Amnibacterium soli]|uniref:hypothetical protein n=1 Tax=Amnibacterium soli TaxID=1282736 RepID=UPI003CD08981
MADALCIEARTVEEQVEHIRAELGARSRTEAAARWPARPPGRCARCRRRTRPAPQCTGVPWWKRRRHSPSIRCHSELRLATSVTPSSGYAVSLR